MSFDDLDEFIVNNFFLHILHSIMFVCETVLSLVNDLTLLFDDKEDLGALAIQMGRTSVVGASSGLGS